MDVTHYSVERRTYADGRIEHSVVRHERNGQCLTMYLGTGDGAEAEAHFHAEALAIRLHTQDVLSGVQPDRPDLAHAIAVLKGGAR